MCRDRGAAEGAAASGEGGHEQPGVSQVRGGIPSGREPPVDHDGSGGSQDDVGGLEVQVEQPVARPESLGDPGGSGQGVQPVQKRGQEPSVSSGGPGPIAHRLAEGGPANELEHEIGTPSAEDGGGRVPQLPGMGHHPCLVFGGRAVPVAADRHASAEVVEVGAVPAGHEATGRLRRLVA